MLSTSKGSTTVDSSSLLASSIFSTTLDTYDSNDSAIDIDIDAVDSVLSNRTLVPLACVIIIVEGFDLRSKSTTQCKEVPVLL